MKIIPLKPIHRSKAFDYFILVSRVLLAWTFLSYGLSKLDGNGQFGIKPEEMNTPIKDLSLFKVGWYLFEHEPFVTFVGICQVLCALLLLYNRTVLLGAFFFLPIVSNILIIDLTIMPTGLDIAFGFRLSMYILLDLLIIWHYRERMIKVWDVLVKGITTKFKYPIWAYLFLPIFAILLEFITAIPKLVYYLIIQPSQTIEVLRDSFELFIKLGELIIP